MQAKTGAAETNYQKMAVSDAEASLVTVSKLSPFHSRLGEPSSKQAFSLCLETMWLSMVEPQSVLESVLEPQRS